MAKDPYLSALYEHWDTIATAYRDQHANRPIIEYRLPEQVICSYPASAFIDDLTVRTREATRLQYQEASARGDILVFVRDSDKRILRSYEFPLDDAPAPTPQQQPNRKRP